MSRGVSLLENRGIVETVEMSNGRKAKYVYGMGIDINRYKVVEEEMAIACARQRNPIG